MKTVKLTVAQAVIKYLNKQYIIINGKKEKLFYGAFGIFGHGNVTCIAEALYDIKEEFPTYRGQNEQSMALAAIGYTKAKNRKQIMLATTSIGPGATNMITAAGVAYTNSLPLLMISGDYFDNRLSSPVLQEIEQTYNPTISANDCFKPLVKYWDRITNPAQITQSLPSAISTMLNPSTCGPSFIGICQDTQSLSYDYPIDFFQERIHNVPRNRASKDEILNAMKIIRKAKFPIIIAGGGVLYADASKELTQFAEKMNIPFGTTVTAKAITTHDEKLNIGPVGVSGSKSINELINKADLIIAIGTKLQDFTTGSWSLFNKKAKFISINTTRFDAIKHMSYPIVGDAKETLKELIKKCKDLKKDNEYIEQALKNKEKYNQYIEKRISQKNEIPSYGNVIGVINKLASKNDRVIAAAGGLPGELNILWKVKGLNTIDNEYGFSCMGYEISGGYGSAIAHKKGETIVFTGDGSYMMLNSEIYSSVLTGDKMIIIVCDNEGFAVINRLQINQGGEPFNNLIQDCKLKDNVFMTDFVGHAKSMGADGVLVEKIEDLEKAFLQAKKSKKTFVIHIQVSKYNWSEYSNTWWETGVPEVNHKDKINKARKQYEQNVKKQRRGI